MSDNRYDLMIAASFLEQGRFINQLSAILTGLAILPLIFSSGFEDRKPILVFIISTIILLAGLCQFYFAFRVSFDAALFRGLAAQNHTANLEAFDTAMQRQGLMPAEKAGRPVADRIAGARRLFGRQAAMLILQIAVLLAGAIIAAMR